VGELKRIFDARVEPENSIVNREAIVLAGKHPGDLIIDQIASIYSYLKNNNDPNKGWSYVRDTRGIDNYRYANETLEIGKELGCAGAGDCDDFAILMSALIESIGGTTRIILARNNTTGGHAYSEVYLGNLNEPNNKVEGIIDWLKQEFNADKIFTHIDTDTKDVWLNLDWGPDEKGSTHPGGPFYQGDKHIVLCIRDKYEKTPLKMAESNQEEARSSPSALSKIEANVPENSNTIQGKNVCTGADMGDYAKLVFCLPSEVAVEPETMAESNYAGGREVGASMLLDGKRVELQLLYPCEAPQKQLEPAELKPYLEAFDPVMAQTVYNESYAGTSLLGRLGNRNVIAYQPNDLTIALLMMDVDMSETMVATFLSNLSISVNEGITQPGNCADTTTTEDNPVPGPTTGAEMTAAEKMGAENDRIREALARAKRRL
jgi:hypothetical protein